MRTKNWTVACLLILLLTLSVSAEDTERTIANPFRKDKAAIEAGRLQFNSGCAVCHGPTGQGGRGSRLAEVYRVQRMPDAKIFGIIREGVTGTEMPPSALPDEKLWQIVSFIRSLNASAIDEDVPGDAAAGKSLFLANGRCSACHMIRGRGGVVGPDLSDVGARRSQDKLRQSIQDPDAFIEAGYAKVTAVTIAGQRVYGAAKNNSSYSIQIQDAQGKFYSLLKKNLRTLTHHAGSLMPKLSFWETEMQNLLAFLSRQSLEAPAEQARRVEHGKEIEP